MQAALHKRKDAEAAPVTAMEINVLKTLAYFDIFNYPLTAAEIRQFLGCSSTVEQLRETLSLLLADERIFLYNDFYSLQRNPFLGYRRIKGNERAAKLLQKANRIGKFLYHFPFVRAVAVSGSLSKNFAGEDADIDFFIITRSNRLWIARTLMHLFKKLSFLTGRQHFYCMNYYLDETALLLQDQNIFTATELKTLLPVCGAETIRAFFIANKWAEDWLPSCDFRVQREKDPAGHFFKSAGEWIFNNHVGERLDNWLLKQTSRRWERKRQKGKQNKKGDLMGLFTGKHFARSNPGSFQEKVLAIHEEKLVSLHVCEQE